jgi:hypothetical protein
MLNWKSFIKTMAEVDPDSGLSWLQVLKDQIIFGIFFGLLYFSPEISQLWGGQVRQHQYNRILVVAWVSMFINLLALASGVYELLNRK